MRARFFIVVIAGVILAGCSTDEKKAEAASTQAARADRNAYRGRRDTKDRQDHFRDRIPSPRRDRLG